VRIYKFCIYCQASNHGNRLVEDGVHPQTGDKYWACQNVRRCEDRVIASWPKDEEPRFGDFTAYAL
jgi:hypothetical protein